MLHDNELPSDPEHRAMAEFLIRENIQIIDTGHYPLISYCSDYNEKIGLITDTERDELLVNGGHLRAALMAVRHGIPVSQWPNKLINLTRIFKNPLSMKSPRLYNDWNGIWINKTHGGPGVIQISLPLQQGQCATSNISAQTFYILFVKQVLEHERFRYGILASCESVRDKDSGGNSCVPFISELKNLCTSKVTLYGAYGSSWVPLYGPHAGTVLLAPEPFIYGPQRNLYLTGAGKLRKGAFNDFLSKDEELAENARLTDLYYEHAAFNPDNARQIDDHSQNNRARFWFRA
ncbi:hypothetical protein [Govanella unica]|uniref:Uncharacterized protein n=1 Tax=Govanella unica TaxID=2975056 RepID=A0A9X3TX17_9PROT|nr:hypothetical protein [Govania unica]MDA5193257.1 hypothetical protein [Govania unica]